MSSNLSRMSEADVAAALGVSVEVVRKLRPRRLSANVHYWSAGAGYEYGPEAVELLMAHLPDAKKEGGGTPAAPVLSAAPAGAAEKKKRGPVRLSLLKAKPSGRHWSAAVIGDEKAGTVVVDVRNGAHFRQGMELEADPVDGQPGCFCFSGRLPQRPGKWR